MARRHGPGPDRRGAQDLAQVAANAADALVFLARVVREAGLGAIAVRLTMIAADLKIIAHDAMGKARPEDAGDEEAAVDRTKLC